MLWLLSLFAWSVLGQNARSKFPRLKNERSRNGRQDDATQTPNPTPNRNPNQFNFNINPTKVPDQTDNCKMPSQQSFFQNIKHDYTFSDISTAAPTRFSDMGYLLFGYDLYKGNLLTFGFDPGFRHPLFDYGKLEEYMLTLDARHNLPPGTSALPSQACTATFRQTVIQTEDDLQERQGFVYEEARGFSFDGSELADAIPEEAVKNPKVQAIVGGVKTLKAGHASMNNDEYKGEMISASREDTTTIIAEAECNVYQAKLNQQAPPPLLPEVKAWICKMLNIQQTGQKKKLRGEIIKFLDYYGTHIVAEINFGARYMYNFTLTSKNEAELMDNFKSFKSAVTNELNILGFGASSKKDKSEEQAILKKAKKFEEIVETTVKSVGAPLPTIKDDGSPDSEAWVSATFENPVPVKLKLVGIENILDEQFLGKENVCKKEFQKAELEKLKEEFVLMLPRKVVTACKRTEKHCETVLLKGEELDRANKLFECAQAAVQFEGLVEVGEVNKFSGLLDVLTTGATDEEKRCLEKNKITEKLKTSFDAIKTHLDLDLYNLLGPGQGVGGIFKLIFTVADDSPAEGFLNLLGIQTDPNIPTRCRTVLDKFLRGDVGALVRGSFDAIVDFFTGTSKEEEEEMAECMRIAENIKKKKQLWDKYGMKILEGLKPENLAKECFSKTKCCTITRVKACTKIAGLKNSYTEALSKRGGIPVDDLLLISETDSIEERVQEEVIKGIQTMDAQEDECKMCEDDAKDEGPEECKKNDDDDIPAVDSLTGPTSTNLASDDDPCRKLLNKGKLVKVDCCNTKYIDPRNFGRDTLSNCSDCKNCPNGCFVRCSPLTSDEDKEKRERECRGKKGEKIEFITATGKLLFITC